MLCTLTSDGEFTVEDAQLDEAFTTDLLAIADRRHLSIEDGCVTLHATNGTWWYQIVGFPTGDEVQTTLVRYEPA